MKKALWTVPAGTLLCSVALAAWAQAPAAVPAGGRVTPENYARAVTDRNFADIAAKAGGVNQLYFNRSVPKPYEDKMPHMERDMLYGGGIIDTAGGATITVPELPKDRYFSIQLIDNDHYMPPVIYTAGEHKLPQNTKYVYAAIRIQVLNPKDADEMAMLKQWQDRFVISARSAEPFPPLLWDTQSLKTLDDRYQKESQQLISYAAGFGPRGKVDDKVFNAAVAGDWGGFPRQDAVALESGGDHDPKKCYTARYRVPANKGLWSLAVYGADGLIKSDNSMVDSSSVKLNEDGSFSVYFGSKELCGDRPNRLDVADGWTAVMRVYKPGDAVRSGAYKLAAVAPVK